MKDDLLNMTQIWAWKPSFGPILILIGMHLDEGRLQQPGLPTHRNESPRQRIDGISPGMDHGGMRKMLGCVLSPSFVSQVGGCDAAAIVVVVVVVEIEANVDSQPYGFSNFYSGSLLSSP